MDLTEKTSNENRHPWELSRANCVLNIVKKYKLESVADIGSGDRFFASKLRLLLSGTIYAVDAGYKEKSEIIDGIHCINDISGLPKLDEKSGLILMDVLEHIEDDADFLEKLLEKASKNTLVLITVPAFQFLFSNHDAFLKHHRRYNKKLLLSLLASQNIYVEESRYFYTSLFFARLVSLLFEKKNKQVGIGGWRFGKKHIITRVIYAILNMDFHICSFFAKLHIYLPGLSLLAVCKKT